MARIMVGLVMAWVCSVSTALTGDVVTVLQGDVVRADADALLMEMDTRLGRIAGQLQEHLDTNVAVMMAASAAYKAEVSSTVPTWVDCCKESIQTKKSTLLTRGSSWACKVIMSVTDKGKGAQTCIHDTETTSQKYTTRCSEPSISGLPICTHVKGL